MLGVALLGRVRQGAAWRGLYHIHKRFWAGLGNAWLGLAGLGEVRAVQNFTKKEKTYD
jgi:hypothetical protein